MAAAGKWLSGIDRATPFGEVADVVLRARFDAVRYYLPRAAKKPHDDIENVHQLRVATRRAAAAVSMFDVVLPAKKARWLNRRLKRIRRAAGEARDLDVAQQRLASMVSRCDAALIALLCEVERQRRRAQRPLRRVHRRLKKKRFFKKVDRLFARLGRGDRSRTAQQPFSQFAQAALAGAAGEFFAQANCLDVENADSLHEMRIQGKRLRYTIEIVAPAFDVALRTSVYPAVEALQEQLGVMSDHYRLAELIQRAIADLANDQWRDRLEQLNQAEVTAAEEARQLFAQQWRQDQGQHLRRQLEELAVSTADRKIA